MLLIFSAILIGWLGLVSSQLYLLLKHPYLQPTTPRSLTAQLKLAHHVRQQATTNQPGLHKLGWLSWLSIGSGLGCLLISGYLVEAKLDLLIFPTKTAMVSAGLLLIGNALLVVAPLIWPTQHYRYWTTKTTAAQPFRLSTPAQLTKYRQHLLWAVVGLIGLTSTLWISRVWFTSTSPVITLEFLLIGAIIMIPILAIVTALSQLPYLVTTYYLTATTTPKVRFSRLSWRAWQALIAQQPTLKRPRLVVTISRIDGYLLGLGAFGILYTNILAPAFTADPTAVFPAAILALVALCLLEIIGTVWPQRNYAYLQTLDTTQLPFKVRERETFARFHYHLYYYHLSMGVVWLVIWIAIVGAYYYFT